MTTDTQERLLAFITRNFMVERDEIDLSKSLIDEGIIDSFGLVEIGAFMETEFAIAVADSDMIRENFGSVLKMVAFVNRRMAE